MERAQTLNITLFEQHLADWSCEFDERFAGVFDDQPDAPAELIEAMRYAALGGGKRIRPFLVTRCCEICGGDAEHAFPAAAAIECVHTFSLVHDDLPAMDDDDLRRGRPTAHKQFGEAMAILAGDALLSLAFELAAKTEQRTVEGVIQLARGTGWAGMIGGQVLDITSVGRPPSRELTDAIHLRKTAVLIETACLLGGLAADCDQSQLESLGSFGRNLGRSFQAVDDILDVTATVERMGKKVGKDAAAGKQTLPSAVGLDKSRSLARAYADDAITALGNFGSEADDLRTLAVFVLERQH